MDVKGYTIGSEMTLDVDDSIWVEADARGWIVTVCIANVAAAIAVGSVHDVTAHRRIETLYHPGNRSTPMIPRRFSENACSLLEGQERSVMAIRIRLDHMLDPQGLPTISATKLKSQAKLSHKQIPSILSDESHPLHKEVFTASKLASGLMDKRRRDGAFVLYDLSSGWVMTETGHVRQLKDVTETVGYIIVQELMVLANGELARFCVEKNIPVPFRNHVARRSAPSRGRMMEMIHQGLESAVPAEFERAREGFMMVMEKAHYSASPQGHYGLNLPAYLHGTSPIRRYADLITQRQVIGYLAGGNIPYDHGQVDEMCSHINDTLEKVSQKRTWEEVNRANNRTENHIKGGRLSKIKAKDFERVVKVSVRGEFDAGVSAEFLRRLDSNKRSLINTFQILLKGGDEWIDTKRKIIDYLVDHPSDASSISVIAEQAGFWKGPKFDVRRGGSEAFVVHIASLSFEEPEIKTEECRGGTLKLAKQMATIDAMCICIGEPRPKWPEFKAPSASKKKSKLPDIKSTNPIGELAEYCQAMGIDLPEYIDERVGGSDHKPNFSVQCKAAGVHVKSPPLASKKAAKKDSARRVIQLILERS